MNTFIEFVAKNPDNPGGNTAQTFDIAGIALFTLFAIVAVFGIVSILTSKGSIKTISSNLATKVANVFNVKILYAIFAILAALLLIFAVMFGNKQAYADSATQTKVADKVTAYVDTNTGEISIEPGFISSTDTNIVLLNSVDLSLCEGILDGNCNWKISSDDKILFEGKAGEAQSLTPPFQIYQDSEVPITFSTDMNLETAKSLIGKKVASVSFDLTQKEAVYYIASVQLNSGTVTAEGEAALKADGWSESGGSWSKNFIEGIRHSVILPTWNELIASEKVQAPNTYIFDNWNIVPAGERFLSSTIYTAQWVKKPIIEAKILDEGVPVGGATVSLFDENGNLVEKALTDNQGKYLFKNLPEDFKGYVNIETKPGSSEGLAGASALISVDGLTKVEIPSQPKSILTGQASSAQSGVIVKFATEDGKVFYTTTDSQGKYKLPVSANTKGNLSFDAGDDSITNNYNNITTSEPGSTSEYDIYITPASESSKITGAILPRVSGNTVQFIDSKGLVYTAITEDNGRYDLIVPANEKGTFYVLANKNTTTYLYMEDMLSPDAGKSTAATRDASVSKVVRVNLDPQTTVGGYMPEGWNKDSDPNQYMKEFASTTDDNLILNEWDITKITSPTDQVFKNWSLSGNNKYIPVWVSKDTIQIKGRIKDANGHFERGVSISIYDATGKLVTSVLSDNNGNFATFLDAPIPNAQIKIEGKSGYCLNDISSDINMNLTGSVDLEEVTVYDKTIYKGALKDPYGTKISTDLTVKFETEEGDSFAIKTSDGNYNISVYAGTKGKFTFDAGDEYVATEIDLITASIKDFSPTTLDVVVCKKNESATISGIVTPPKEGVEINFVYPSGLKNISYTDAEGKYSINVVPNIDGELFIIDHSENVTFASPITSPYQGGTIEKNVTMNAATVTIDIDSGSVSDYSIPIGWTRISNNTFSKKYVIDSTFKCILKGWKEVIVPIDTLYFNGWSVDVESTLSQNTTAKVLYTNYFLVGKFPDDVKGSFVIGDSSIIKKNSYVDISDDNKTIDFYDPDTGELVCKYVVELMGYSSISWSFESEKLFEFYVTSCLIAPVKFIPSCSLISNDNPDNNEFSPDDEINEPDFDEFLSFDFIKDLFAYKD